MVSKTYSREYGHPPSLQLIVRLALPLSQLGEGGQYANRQQCSNHTNKKQLLLITLRNLILK
jgi:hypothetical protein